MDTQTAARPTFMFQIVTPENVLFSETVEMVVIPGSQGFFGVLPNHAPLIAHLQSGVVSIHQWGKITHKIFVGGGIANVYEGGCTLLADESIPLEDIDAKEVEAYIAKVTIDLEKALEEDLRKSLEDTLMIARAKIELVEKLRKH